MRSHCFREVQRVGSDRQAQSGNSRKIYIFAPRRNGRVVECGGLENRCTLTGTGGSNPSFSANSLPRDLRSRLYFLRLPPSLLGEMPQKRKAFSDRRIARQAVGTSPPSGIMPTERRHNHWRIARQAVGTYF